MNRAEFESRVADRIGRAAKQLGEEIVGLHQRSAADLNSSNTMVRSEKLTIPILHGLVLAISDDYEAVKANDHNGALAALARAQLEAFCSTIWTGWNTDRLMLDGSAVRDGQQRVSKASEAALSLFDRLIPAQLAAAPTDDQPTPEARLPASDRYVTISDNVRADVTAEITALRSAAEKANDVTDEERLIAMSELAAFEATITQPRVSSALIERFLKHVLAWLQNIIPKALIGAAAEKLIAKLLPFLG